MPHRNPQREIAKLGIPGSLTRRRPDRLAEPFTFARLSSASEEHQERNEDRIIADPSRGLAAVFDGVGGIAGGEIAAHLAAQSIRSCWKRLIQCHSKKPEKPRNRNEGQTDAWLLMDDAADVATFVREMIDAAHTETRREGARRVRDRYGNLPGTSTPKTTIALAALCHSSRSQGYSLIYAWVGDSRVYLLPNQGPLTRLTEDDGLLTELVKIGLIDDEIARHVDQATQPWHLRKEERLFFERRNGITQALGDEVAPAVHVQRSDVAPGDRLLLCTDGIHDNLTDDELEALLREGARTTVARRIVAAAAARSRLDTVENIRAKPDDMSAVVITCHH